MIDALREHWPEYLIEATLLGAFMASACATVALVAHPASPLARRVQSPLARRALIGLSMGLTAIVLITSPLGRRSGAHMNPATTLAFLSLGKVRAWDAAFYVLAQFAGGLAGVGIMRALIGRVVSHASVGYVATHPPDESRAASLRAWAAEFGITFLLFTAVLIFSNDSTLAAFTPFAVGLLVWLYITFEAPISGMSMNPARTFASAAHTGSFRTLWIYLTAPVLAMLLAGQAYAAFAGARRVYCAKLDHRGDHRCIFHCHIGEMHSHEPRP